MILPALPAHVPAMIDIYNHAIDDRVYANCDERIVDSWHFESLYLGSPSPDSSRLERRCFVSIDTDGSVAAWGALKPFSALPCDSSIAEVAVYVSRLSRSRGIGIRLLRHIIGCDAAMRLSSLVAVILAKNVASIRGSAACGFTECARLSGIATLHDTSEDIVWMQRMIVEERAS